LHNLGLELIEAEGDLWGVHFPAPEVVKDEVAAEVWLACRRCGEKLLTTVPEAEYGHLTGGFLIARNCAQCKATTTWEFTEDVAATPAGETGEPAGAPRPGSAPLQQAADTDLRLKGRAPLQMPAKVTRHKYGTEIEDVCETLNVSRNGVLFQTSLHYDVGETVHVVLPYREGDVAIAVPGRVVRTDVAKNPFLRAVAVHLEKELRHEWEPPGSGQRKEVRK
jgi:PilZ domain-containing protein